jgi:twitching motility protein PilU
MEKSLAEGSQTFEQDIARLINEGIVSRDEGMAYADSPTNLLWRLQNEQAPISRITPSKKDEPEAASFTEIVIDVRGEEPPVRKPGVPAGPYASAAGGGAGGRG